MLWLRYVLFESALALSAALLVLLFILFAYWRRSGRVLPFLAGVICVAALLATNLLVLSPRERASRALRAIQNDLLEGRSDALAVDLAADFRAGPFDREAFLEFVEEALHSTKISLLIQTTLEADPIADGRFAARVAYLAQIDTPRGADVVKSRWRLQFEERADGYRIVTIEPERLQDTDIAGWDEFLGLSGRP